MTERESAFLVLHATGGIARTYVPGTQNERDAHAYASEIGGIVVPLPVEGDYRSPEDLAGSWSAYRGEKEFRVANKGNINAEPEPPNHSKVVITSGPRAGTEFSRTDVAEKAFGAGTELRWWSLGESRWRSWMQVQQQVGEADWEIR